MRLGAIVIDGDDIEALSDFYKELLGWTKTCQVHDGEKWIIVAKVDYSETPLVFQDNPDYRPPKWPSEPEAQQQMVHLDFYVSTDQFENKIKHALACGARELETQFTDGWRVLADPAGHPFCIIPIPADVYQQRYC